MPKYYLLDENKNLVEGFDKEGFLALLEQAIEDGSLENIDENSAVASKLRSVLNGTTHNIEFVTEAQYNQLEAEGELVPNTYYFITDDTTYEGLETTINQVLEDIEALQESVGGIVDGTIVVPNATHSEDTEKIKGVPLPNNPASDDKTYLLARKNNLNLWKEHKDLFEHNCILTLSFQNSGDYYYLRLAFSVISVKKTAFTFNTLLSEYLPTNANLSITKSVSFDLVIDSSSAPPIYFGFAPVLHFICENNSKRIEVPLSTYKIYSSAQSKQSFTLANISISGKTLVDIAGFEDNIRELQ